MELGFWVCFCARPLPISKGYPCVLLSTPWWPFLLTGF
ncbi:unnamed protein product [Larinioides sclopetarius]|uniref:Uncharacterized protein n=1 Tax=Larinioides sclopetarius TaxID=280406 RepID=A0AAV2ARF0_9ARAC